MTWVLAILGVLAMGAIALIAAGRGGPLAPVHDDRPDPGLPTARTLAAEDLRRVRFPLALRGYRMAEVDALLDRLARELDADRPSPQDPPGSQDAPSPEA